MCLSTSDGSNNEILIYKLPELTVDNEDGLSKDREISIHAAGSHNKPCHSLAMNTHTAQVTRMPYTDVV